MVTPKHPKFVLVETPQEFIRKCDEILSKQQVMTKQRKLKSTLRSFYNYIAGTSNIPQTDFNFILNANVSPINKHGYLMEFLSKALQSILVSVFVVFAYQNSGQQSCNTATQSKLTLMFIVVAMVVNFSLNTMGMLYLYVLDFEARFLYVRIIRATSFTLFLSGIAVYFYVFHFIGSGDCSFEYLWLSTVALMFFGATLSVMFWAFIYLLISFALGLVLTVVALPIGLIVAVAYIVLITVIRTCHQCGKTGADHIKLDKDQNKAKNKDEDVKKLLFLGSGYSGKSTMVKQLFRIHGSGWSKSHRLRFIAHIHAQIIEEMKLAVEYIEFLAEEELINEYGDDYKKPDDFNAFSALSDDAQRAVAILQSVRNPKLNEEVGEACKVLWNEQKMKEIYDRRATMKLTDSSAYFWGRIEEIMQTEYVPNDDDMLLLNDRTTGVVEMNLTIQKNIYHILDTGGEKAERKKWIHCFEGVTAVLYVVSLSQFDEVMYEDESVNCMVDNLQLFETICNNDYLFENTTMILLLNKTDLFAEKIHDNKPITLCPEFADYAGSPTSFDETTSYIKEKFLEKNKSPDEKTIFVYLTCAVDRNNIEKVFNDIVHTIAEDISIVYSHLDCLD